MENRESIHILFERYLTDQCSPAEVRALLAYFNMPEDHDQLRDIISQHFDAEKHASEPDSEALEEVYQELLTKVKFEDRIIPEPTSFLWPSRWLRVAAVWVLLALSGGATVYFLSRWSNDSETKPLAVESAEPIRTEQTSIGERKTVKLEDGSLVWLNAQSRLTYPESFKEGSREVRLEGEAYFEIFRDVERPFTIRSGAIETRVLGTSFNIKAYQADPTVAVTVATGKVEVSARESSVQIIENQQVNYTDGKLAKELGVDVSAQMSWRTGKMQFRNVPISEVIKTLQRNYPVQIAYSDRVSECLVHADFDAGTPVESILEMLAVSLNGKLIKRGNAHYDLDGNCKTNPAHLSQ